MDIQDTFVKILIERSLAIKVVNDCTIDPVSRGIEKKNIEMADKVIKEVFNTLIYLN